VALAMHIPTGKRVAIKMMDDLFDNETDCKRVLRELVLL